MKDAAAQAGELNETDTYNAADEMTARRSMTPVYDAVGNLTDDGRDYTYVYDAFGRLVSVSTRGGSPVLVGEYRYNGLGFRIACHNDVSRSGGGDNPDGTVDSNDPWYFSAYDENWRLPAGSGSAARGPAARRSGSGHSSRQRCWLGGEADTWWGKGGRISDGIGQGPRAARRAHDHGFWYPPPPRAAWQRTRPPLRRPRAPPDRTPRRRDVSEARTGLPTPSLVWVQSPGSGDTRYPTAGGEHHRVQIAVRG